MIDYRDYEDIKLSMFKKDISRIEKENNINIFFCYENKLTNSFYIPDNELHGLYGVTNN